MMRSHGVIKLLAAAALLNTLPLPSRAIDLSGAWASDAGMCDKVFRKKGSALSFTSNSDLYGAGFILEGKQIRGKAARCTIKSRKEDGPITHLIAACATDVMLSNVQFTLKVIDDTTISRLFPGMEGMEIQYYRCAL